MSRKHPPFQFKQFSIQHDLCAMKVGVDGVLLAAWSNEDSPKTILDVGTGSGVITLIMCQKHSKSKVYSIDSNALAIKQSKININNSPFNTEVDLIHSSFQDFNPTEKLDLIISNPPYFVDGTPTKDPNRDEARQARFLPLDDLFPKAASLLTENGKVQIVYPTEYTNTVIEIANKNGLYCNRRTIVYGTHGKPSKRSLFSFQKEDTNTLIDDITIQFEKDNFTSEYIDLTKDFYLNF